MELYCSLVLDFEDVMYRIGGEAWKHGASLCGAAE